MKVEINKHYKCYKIEVCGLVYQLEYISYEAAFKSDVYKFFKDLFDE
jgi:hypothetical protein